MYTIPLGIYQNHTAISVQIKHCRKTMNVLVGGMVVWYKVKGYVLYTRYINLVRRVMCSSNTEYDVVSKIYQYRNHFLYL